MKNLYKIEDELYIVDNTEEINKDTKICWCINTSNNEVVLHQGVLPAYHYKYYKKIIMTTNTSINLLCGCGKNCGAKESGIQAIDDEFLEWFMKNPSRELVEVEKGCVLYDFKYKIIIPKEEADYTALLQPVGTIQETLEEFEAALIKFPEYDQFLERIGYEEGAKWQQERMYSEEEVLDILLQTESHSSRTKILKLAMKQWFEQITKN